MPTYEYACTSCGHHTDAVQSFSDDPLTTCPECGGPLRKVYGAVGIVLKGSGFYKTDSRTSPGAKSGNGSSDGSSKEGSPKETSGGSGDAASTPKSESGATGGAKEKPGGSSDGAKAAAAST